MYAHVTCPALQKTSRGLRVGLLHGPGLSWRRRPGRGDQQRGGCSTGGSVQWPQKPAESLRWRHLVKMGKMDGGFFLG